MTENEKRKYYRFRKADFYGGIATADCVGYNLNCFFCWSDKPRRKPETTGNFHELGEVGDKLVEMAEEAQPGQVRISGNEPTLGRNHLLKVLDMVDNSGLGFILETNGILLGKNPSYAQELSSFENLHVRVSLKGCNEDQFSELTGANPESFKLQLISLKNLVSAGCDCHASVISDFSEKNEIMNLKKRLEDIKPALATKLELEKLKFYPHVKERLEDHDLL